MGRKSKYESKQIRDAARYLHGAFEAGRIGPGLQALLDSVDGPGWREGAPHRRVTFEEAFAMLEDYVAEFGNAGVPQSYLTEDGYPLGR